VHHGASETEVQVEAVVVTVKLVVPAGGVTFWFEGERVKEGAVPAWVTVTTTGVSPTTVTVTFATRGVVSVFSV
jgi:hypothetical protein